jgi:hypothetical protein
MLIEGGGEEDDAPAMIDPNIKISDDVRPLSGLKPDPKNARRHPESQIASIVESVEAFGYVNKIAIRPDGTMIGGHATKIALERVGGYDKVEVRVVDGLTERQYRALGAALNKIPEGSSWDSGLLAEIVGELYEADDPALDAIGLSDKEVKALLETKDDLEVKEIATDQVDDEFWISVRGPLADQAAALKMLEQVMAKFPGVSVDLGTISLGP